METFKSLVEAVQENNSMNDAKWSDWTDSKHVQEVYGQLSNDKWKEMHEAMIDLLINYDGENLEAYLDLISFIEYGKILSPHFT